eukprot:8378152-Pyramimonas_sp.AAC.1
MEGRRWGGVVCLPVVVARPNNKCGLKPTTAAVGQAASCLKWTPSAARPTASPVQNEQELLL